MYTLSQEKKNRGRYYFKNSIEKKSTSIIIELIISQEAVVQSKVSAIPGGPFVFFTPV